MNGDITVNIEYIIKHENEKDNEARSITFSSFEHLYDIFFKDEIKSGKMKSSKDISKDECKKALIELDTDTKLKKLAKIADIVKTGFCSINRSGDEISCMSTSILKKWVRELYPPAEYNEFFKREKDEDFRQFLLNVILNYYGLKTEEGIVQMINADDVLDYLSHDLLEKIKSSYKPVGPVDKSWLSNIEIDNVLQQYEIKLNRYRNYNDLFKFGGTYCIDFMDYPQYYPIVGYLKNKFKNDANIQYVGLVLNHDKRSQNGSHWVAYVIDKKDKKIFYYDSVGEKPKRKHEEMFKILNSSFGENFDVYYHKKLTQTSGGDCGIYAICFIIYMMLSKNMQETFNEYDHLKLTPRFINSLRPYIFYDCKKLPDYY